MRRNVIDFHGRCSIVGQQPVDDFVEGEEALTSPVAPSVLVFPDYGVVLYKTAG